MRGLFALQLPSPSEARFRRGTFAASGRARVPKPHEVRTLVSGDSAASGWSTKSPREPGRSDLKTLACRPVATIGAKKSDLKISYELQKSVEGFGIFM